MRTYARRFFAIAALAGGLALVYLAAAPILPWSSSGGPAPAVAQAGDTVAARPKSVPARVPQWAWDFTAWRAAGGKGKRPASVPYHVPDWYWDWAAWRAKSAAR